MIQKGDIYYVRPYNSHQKKHSRPAVILSGNQMNRDSDAVIVAFLSNTPNASLDPSGVSILSMGQKSFAITNKLSTITKDRLTNRVTRATPEELTRLESSLCRVLEL